MHSRFMVVVAAVLGFIVAVWLHLPYVNGPGYWQWPWRDIGFIRGILFLGLPLLPFACALGRIRSDLSEAEVRRILGLFLLSQVLMTVMGILVDPTDAPLLRSIIRSPSATSYYTDAENIADPLQWLSRFHRQELSLHSSTHPPGPVLYYYLWLSMLGPNGGDIAAACGIAVLSGLGVPVLFRFSGLWTSDLAARLLSCALYVLMPGMLFFFPAFDALYPVFSMLLFLFWCQSLDGAERASHAFGAVLFASTLFAYNLFAAGGLLLLLTLTHIAPRRRDPASWILLGRIVLRAGVTFAVLNLLLWIVTGYRPIQSFAHALATQAGHAGKLGRPYLSCLSFDLYDFSVGGGVLPAILLVLMLTRQPSDELRLARRMAFIGLFGVLIVDISGLLRCETARVWLFLQPWVVVPAALELRAFSPNRIGLLSGLHWMVAVSVKCNMWFVYV